MKEKHTITKSTKMQMVMFTLLFDLISLIPIVDLFTDPIWQMSMALWFHMNGINYNSTKRISSVVAGTVIGLIPGLNMLPELTLELFIIFSTIEMEKVAAVVPGGEQALSAASGGKTAPPQIPSAPKPAPTPIRPPQDRPQFDSLDKAA
jgi:hypothetical protein